MERALKSIAITAIAHGIAIYTPTGNKNYVIGTRLVCADCNEPWPTMLNECFLCGSINPFLYRCEICDAFSSLTRASKKCDKCGRQGTLRQECPLDDCLSNANEYVRKKINEKGGVFERSSGFQIPMQRCLDCGSQAHVYEVRKLIVFTASSSQINKANLQIDDPDVFEHYTYIIFRICRNDRITYSLLKLDQYINAEDNFQLNYLETDIGRIFDEIFKKKGNQDSQTKPSRQRDRTRRSKN